VICSGPPGAEHPWPSELPAGRLGAFAREPLAVTLVGPALVVEVEADTAFEFGSIGSGPTPLVSCARAELSPSDIKPPIH
jgi:hypothetical protein